MNRLLHRRQMQGHLPFPYRGVSDTQTISNARGGICRPFYMARNTVRKVLAAPCFYVSSKKLKIFWSKSPEAMSISDGQRKKLHFLKSANLFVYQIHLITPHGHLVKSLRKPQEKFCADFLLRAVLYLHEIHPSARGGRFERSGSRKEDELNEEACFHHAGAGYVHESGGLRR